MKLLKFFRLYAPEPGDSGSGPVDRGDSLEPIAPVVVEPVDPLATAAAKELAAELEADPAEADDKRKDSRIPLSRHEAVLNKARAETQAALAELAKYQTANQTAEVNADVAALDTSVAQLEKDYANLLTDGEIDKAAAVMAKIRATERQIAEVRSDLKIQAAELRAVDRATYNEALSRVEAAFPTLNPDHEDYDEESMLEVADLAAAYQQRGLNRTAALQKAVKMIVEPRTSRQEKATEVTPNVSEKDVAAERKRDAAEKTVKAIDKTPPSLAKTGINSDKLGGGALDPTAVMGMSQKEFAALSDATLAQMRGDTL